MTALAFLMMIVAAALVPEVRQALSENDFRRAEQMQREYRAAHGDTPESLEAMSWLARSALSAGRLDIAEKYAAQINQLAAARLKSHALDSDPYTPVALGAAIEVEAQVMAARGERSGAVSYLQKELKTYSNTSIRTRIQKNINMLSMEGKLAPPFQTTEWLGGQAAPMVAYRGKPLLLFFWAHWCSDCKQEAPILARIRAEHPGLILIGPTQRYGYVARGEEAAPGVELKYIDQIRHQYYVALLDMPAPVSEDAFRSYGASTTPTLVLIDRHGIVRMYHPGVMTYEELSVKLRDL